MERLGDRAPIRLAAFAASLAAIAGIAALAGAATGGTSAVAASDGALAMETMTPAIEARTDGLASTAAGYTFSPEQTMLTAGTSSYRFRVLDARGRSVSDFTADGGVRLHLIVVRRDLVAYQHLHPRVDHGVWSTPLTLASPGAYRVFADFEVNGEKTVVGRDLFVAGRFVPRALRPVELSTKVDGYTVRRAPARLRAGAATRLSFKVSRAGRPVASFEAYVGQRGHLVALRQGDLAYQHVHPEPRSEPGEIAFHTAFSNAGAYRLFLQFKTDGTVHTAPFTVKVAR